ncbi:MAG: pyridoxal-phosphate dependent enzyme, partial [Cyanobacteriota bacterium]
WDVDPVNLYRITWKNDINTGLFGEVNCIEIPKAITNSKARIFGLVGKYFPTGAHKVGAAFGCLVPRLTTGQFDPTTQKAVWPSTGNYCRGGAFDCALLSCTSVAILPEEMSPERFSWLKGIGAEVIATPGCESNVKEIYDKCWEIKKTRKDCVIFNQFEEFGNAMWHYEVTGKAIEEVYNKISTNKSKMAVYVSATGSAGTLGAGEYLKKAFPKIKVVASEALQCPTLLMNGFGAHRIEGIGDKHIPWIHNVRNTDMVTAIDDEQTMQILRLFNEPEGRCLLAGEGMSEKEIKQLELIGISGICNMVSAMKAAKYWELGEDDIIFTPLTDSVELYQSRVKEMREQHGELTKEGAARLYERYLAGTTIDHLRELNYYDRKALHNLKYFTWVEQQGRTVEELNALWSDSFWEEEFAKADEWDKLIEEFNARVNELVEV